MSAKHNWAVRDIAHFPAIGAYDLDITDEQFGKLCCCKNCGLRVVASEARMPDGVQGMPECRPPTYQTADQVTVERLYLSAVVACGAIGLPEGAVASEEIAVALSIISTHVASRLATWAGEIRWSRRYAEALLLILRFVEMSARDLEEGNDWNWDHYDDDHDWDGEDRFHPDEMQARLRELQARISESILAAEVIES
ncbi:MAG: hypothetical protein WDO69_08550 [Pseudomonadota bacterium]